MGMFPLSALVAHAELKSRAKSAGEAADARRAVRITRYGNLTLFPRVERGEPVDDAGSYGVGEPMPADVIDAVWEEPRVIASISNVSTTGVGLILNDELPTGLQFDVDWDDAGGAGAGERPTPVRFEVVHTKPMTAGLYRTGARLIAGQLPAEPVPTPFVRRFALASEAEPTTAMVATPHAPADRVPPAEPPMAAPEPGPRMSIVRDGVMEMARESSHRAEAGPVPPGTFAATAAAGFEKTERLDGVTTCGWERSIELRRDGQRMWIYIHSPGKRNGWGIFVDPDAFEAAVGRVQAGAGSPFLTTTLAA